MRFDLTALARRAKNPRRKSITLRDIPPPAMLATDLFTAGYKPVLGLIQTYADRLNTEYSRTLSTLQTDSADDLTSILSQMANELSRLVILLTPGLRQWGVRTEKWQRDRWRGAVLSASGVQIDTMIGPEDVAQTVGETIEWNVALVRDVGDQGRAKMAAAVFAGLRARSPARDVAAQIREATGFARDRSLRIASHQLSSLTSTLAAERRREAGIEIWEWIHSAKLHTRLDHLARNGDYYTDNPDLVGKIVNGKEVKLTPEPDDLPGIKPFCGCRERSVLIFD